MLVYACTTAIYKYNPIPWSCTFVHCTCNLEPWHLYHFCYSRIICIPQNCVFNISIRIWTVFRESSILLFFSNFIKLADTACFSVQFFCWSHLVQFNYVLVIFQSLLAEYLSLPRLVLSIMTNKLWDLKSGSHYLDFYSDDQRIFNHMKINDWTDIFSQINWFKLDHTWILWCNMWATLKILITPLKRSCSFSHMHTSMDWEIGESCGLTHYIDFNHWRKSYMSNWIQESNI